MKISIIIPVFNAALYLDRCMRSLFTQKFRDYEIILVDDGSTDASGRLCDAYVGCGNIRAVHRENGGLGMARNSGIDAAAGEFLLFLDPDDYFGPELLENLWRAAERTEADLVIGGHTIMGPRGVKKTCAASSERIFRTEREMRELLYHTVGAPPEGPEDSQYGASACGRLYRRSVVEKGAEKLRFVSERQLISEDLIFNMDFIRRTGSAVVTTDAAYFYCTNAGSLSKRHRDDRFSQDLVLYHAVRERLAAYPEEEYRLCVQRLLISRARYDLMLEVNYHDQAKPSYSLREKVEEVLRAPELRKALDRYPWRRLPVMQGIFAWCMKRRWTGAVLALIRVKRRFL